MVVTAVYNMAEYEHLQCFDAAFKLKAVEFARKNTSRSAGRKFSVNENRVWEWRKQKAIYMYFRLLSELDASLEERPLSLVL